MPKLIDKPLMVGNVQMGFYQAYTDIEPEFIATEPRTRVLPAPYFYEKRLFLWLVKRWEPGENKFFPNGGYEVRDESGGLRSYDLDQIIIHPSVLQHTKTLDKMKRRAEKIGKKRDKTLKKIEQQNNPVKTGKRGRPAMDPAVKAARDTAKTEATQRSGGRKGRPPSNNPKTIVNKIKTNTKRGRPALSAEVISQRTAAREAVRARTGGVRGRPKSR